MANAQLRPAMKKAVVIEETTTFSGRLKHGVPASFYSKYRRQGGLDPLDSSVVDFVKAVHVILPSPVQLYSAANLDVFPHYTLSIGKPLNDLILRATDRSIPVVLYESDKNHLEGEVVKVINNVDQHSQYGDSFQNVNVQGIRNEMSKVKSKDIELRGTYTSHISVSAALGQGWHRPEKHQDLLIQDVELFKPGVTRTMPKDLQTEMGICLNFLGVATQELWSGCGLPVFDDADRQSECSDMLAEALGFGGKVFFEAGTFAHIRDIDQDLAVHCDILNDTSKGYNKTTVLSIVSNEEHQANSERLSVIGYNRRCCYHYMCRLREAKQHAVMCARVSTLELHSRSMVAEIENAALVWLGVLPQSTLLTQSVPIIEAVNKMNLSPFHECRPQIAAVVKAAIRLWPDATTRMTHFVEICLMLTLALYAHSKNHRLNIIRLLGELDQEQSRLLFSSYTNIKETSTVLPTSTDTGGWVDVYNEFSLSKILKESVSPALYDARVLNLFNRVNRQEKLGTIDFLRALKRSKVYLLKGALFQMMTTVTFQSLGFITKDDDFHTYLPPRLTRTAGSVKLVLEAAGFEHPMEARRYMLDFAIDHGIDAIVYENILCKFHVAYFSKRAVK
jgi:hypothetical protein